MNEFAACLGGAKLLVVNDVPVNLDLLVRTWETQGCTMLAQGEAGG